jgi:hypothetical protein
MPLTESLDKVIKIGPAKIQWSTTTTDLLGYCSVKGVTAKWVPKTTDAKIAKYGDTPVKTFYTGGELSVEFEMSQTDFDILSKGSPAVTKLTGGAKSGLGIGAVAGTAVTPVKLVIIPLNSAYIADPTDFTLTIWKAVPLGEPEIMYTTEGGENVYKAKFKALVDETHANCPLGLFGDPASAA